MALFALNPGEYNIQKTPSAPIWKAFVKSRPRSNRSILCSSRFMLEKHLLKNDVYSIDLNIHVNNSNRGFGDISVNFPRMKSDEFKTVRKRQMLLAAWSDCILPAEETTRLWISALGCEGWEQNGCCDMRWWGRAHPWLEHHIGNTDFPLGKLTCMFNRMTFRNLTWW